LPGSLGSTGNFSFQNTNISALVLAEGVERVGGFSFYETHMLSDITFPSSLRSIGPSAFAGAGNTPYGTGLTSVTIPNGVVSIEVGAFRDCSSLQTLTFAGTSSAVTISHEAFLRTRLIAVTLPARAVISQSSFPPECVITRLAE
jgi:hypothetical protein